MRLDWEQVPAMVRDAVQARIGPVIKAESVRGGLMPGVAARLYRERDSVFVKAIRDDAPGARLHRREMWAASALPAGLPTPRVRWRANVAGWHVLVFEYLEDARPADLSPGSPDLPRVLDTVAALHTLLTPCPSGAYPAAWHVEQLQAKAAHLLTVRRSMVPDCEMFHRALRDFTVEQVAGDTLIHYDLNPGNLQIAADGLYVIDWAFASAGQSWVDLVMLVPRLIEAGHTPEQAEELLGRVPGWSDAPEAPVTAMAALWTLFRLYKALFGPEDARDVRARAAEAGRAWVAYRTGRDGAA